jgi:hypothetical protein
MKVKHTQNGNVKVVLSLEQAHGLINILNRSSRLRWHEHDPISYDDEQVSVVLYAKLDEAGIHTTN